MRGRTGGALVVPRIVGPIPWLRPVEAREVDFPRANTDRTIKSTLPAPVTMSRQAKTEFYRDDIEVFLDKNLNVFL